MSERDHGKERGGRLMVTFQIENKNTSSGNLDVNREKKVVVLL